jgi:hypothetical protein
LTNFKEKMFDPSDFLTIAGWLLTREEIVEEEAIFRTSISRAYYATLLIYTLIALREMSWGD